MSMLTAEGLMVRYGDETILEGVSVDVARTDHIALIGPNGCGKSTLLRLLAGESEPTLGSLQRARSARIGYLPQEPQMISERTVLEEMLHANETVRALERSLRETEAKMAETPHDEAVLHQYDELMERFSQAGGYEYESEAREVLAGLGFGSQSYHKPIVQLSGGERARAALASLILAKPDLLLLDEPTNHLDLEALEWLEARLARWPTGYIIVSHDRYLIDRIAQTIWELEFGDLNEYPGNYSKYLGLKQERIERQQKVYDEQQAFIRKSEDFIRRNIAGGQFRENQAKARRLMLEKLERVEPPQTARSIHFTIPMGPPSGREVLSIEARTVGFQSTAEGGSELFRLPAAQVERGQRVAIIGPNGCGKTSLLRVLSGELEPLEGEARWGHNVQCSLYRQSQWEAFQSDATVIDELRAVKDQRISEARQYLGRFLFSGDDVFKRIDQLSGGERSRVALACLAQLGGNTLLLDEPTNHLDLRSREVLEEALSAYPGTILFVSHDRRFIEALATQVWEIRAGRCHLYRGDYHHYRERRAEESKRAAAPERKEDRNPRNRIDQELRQGQGTEGDQEAELVSRLARLEEEVGRLEEALADASYQGDHEQIRSLDARYRAQKGELDRVYREWTALVEAAPDVRSG